MKSEIYKCDICQVEKTENNHWWKGWLFWGGVIVLPWNISWEDIGVQPVIDGTEVHLCGEQHAIQWINQQLSRKE